MDYYPSRKYRCRNFGCQGPTGMNSRVYLTRYFAQTPSLPTPRTMSYSHGEREAGTKDKAMQLQWREVQEPKQDAEVL